MIKYEITLKGTLMFYHLPRTSAYGYDWTYIIILLVLFALSMIVQSVVKNQYKKYSAVRILSGLTGAQAAERILFAQGVYNVRILSSTGADLSDYYDPRTNDITLSQNVYNSASVAAVGIACHEAGHALQEAEGYGPYRLRRTIIPVANVTSRISMVLILAGFVLSIFASQLKFIGMIGVILFAVTVFVQVVTLPVEINASHRALRLLQSEQILTDEELPGARKVLTAAAMTYVVSTLTAVVQLLRFISLFSNRR